MDELRSFMLKKYQSESAKGKTLTFAKNFLKHLTKTKLVLGIRDDCTPWRLRASLQYFPARDGW